MDEFKITPPTDWTDSKSIIKVLGVGGGGCNAVSHMFRQGITGCTFIVCNTDRQVLNLSPVPIKIQLGEGLGAGTDPVKGRNAAIDSLEDIRNVIIDGQTKMLFITTGMGGGTGTGSTPVIAKMAHDEGLLVVGVVTMPFICEGSDVRSRAFDGVRELERNVDSMLVINNEKLYNVCGGMLVQEAFPKVDEVLATAVSSIIGIISTPGHINVDFNDVQTMMRRSGMALMGTGSGKGKDRINEAVRQAFTSPLLNDFDLKTSRNVLVNITIGRNKNGLTMEDLQKLDSTIAQYTGGKNNFKRGIVFNDDPNFDDRLEITAIATGFRLSTFFGMEGLEGNLIQIPRDFVYEDTSSYAGMPTTFNQEKFGYSAAAPSRRFVYDEDNPPILTATNPEKVIDLEYQTAFARKNV